MAICLRTLEPAHRDRRIQPPGFSFKSRQSALNQFGQKKKGKRNGSRRFRWARNRNGGDMTKTLTAVFDGQVLRPEGPVDLKPNARYQVTIEREVRELGDQDAWGTLEELSGTVQGPADWAAEHDHYLYGTSKRGQGSGA
jgi:hypothetical protein